MSAEALQVATDPDCAAADPRDPTLAWAAPVDPRFADERAGCYWVRARLAVPPGPTAWARRAWLAELGAHGRNVLFVTHADGRRDTARMGNDLPVSRRAYPHVWSEAYLNVAPLRLPAGDTVELAFRYRNPEGQTLFGTNDALAVTLVAADALDRDARLHLVVGGLMAGGLLLLCLYQLAQWWVYRTELHLTYCLMLVGLMAYVMYDDFFLHAMLDGRVVRELWLYVTGALGLLGFFRFAQLTLRQVDYRRGRDRLLGWLVVEKAVEVVAFASALLLAAGGVTWLQPVADLVPETFRVLLIGTLLLFSWGVVAHFRENRDRATRAFLLGNLSLVTGVLVVATRAYLLPYAHLAPVGAYLRALEAPFPYLIEAGIVGMALAFAFAVATVTKERELQAERAYSRNLAAVEMKALRAQMNPHFLFNGLNSIKLFVIDNKPREAANYLTKFAKLIRRTLEHSEEALVPLARELETLGLYVELERLRFGDAFAYELTVDEAVDAEAVSVPPLLLQPYVENAIWHGLRHRDAPGGRLAVDVRALGDNPQAGLAIAIEDDGVGRAAAARHRAQSGTRRRSMGLTITAERMDMLRAMYGVEAETRVRDLVAPDGEAAGTRVELRLRT